MPKKLWLLLTGLVALISCNKDKITENKSPYTNKNWTVETAYAKYPDGSIYNNYWNDREYYMKDDVWTWKSDGTYFISDGTIGRPGATTNRYDSGTWSEKDMIINMVSNSPNLGYQPYHIDEATDVQLKLHEKDVHSEATIYYTFEIAQ